MNNYVNFILESGGSLAVFTILYSVVLRSIKQFKANRFYLIFAILFSMVVPFIGFKFNLSWLLVPEANVVGNLPIKMNIMDSITVYASGISNAVHSDTVFYKPVFWMYFIGVLLSVIYLFSGVWYLVYEIYRSRVFKLKPIRIVVTKQATSSFSFFNFIFINHDLTREKNWKTIFYHELEHVRQGHSIDNLIVDLLMVLFWMNPFYWIFRKMVRENHEFLADAAIVNKGNISKGKYKELLLNQMVGGKVVLISNFKKSKLIKRRFNMISNISKNKFGVVKLITSTLVALVITLAFATESNALVQKQMKLNAKEVIVFQNQIIRKNDLDLTTLQKPEMHVLDKAIFESVYPNLKGKIDGEKVAVFLDCSQKEDQVKRNLIQTFLAPKSESVNDKIQKEVVVITKAHSDKNDDENNEVFTIVEQMPEFPDGDLGVRKFVATNVRYPQAAAKKGIKGKVYVKFIIGKDGAIENAKVVRGVDPLLDAEALRVINLMPKWKPGMQRGEKVRVAYTIPINFAMQ